VYVCAGAGAGAGRFVVVCGDGEYIVYTALAWRNKMFGPALEFVWGADANEYARIAEANTERGRSCAVHTHRGR
jgi:hypothetical protein